MPDISYRKRKSGKSIRSHVDHPLKNKLAALRMLKEGVKGTVICNKYRISSSTLSTWKSKKDMYFARESQGMNPKIRRVKQGKMYVVEVATIAWFREMRSRPECPTIDGPMLECVAES